MEISNLVIEYKNTRNEEVFIQIFKKIHKKGRLADNIIRRYGLDSLDVESEINYRLLDLIEKYEPDKGRFENFFTSAIYRSCIDISRRSNIEYEERIDVMIENEETGELVELYEILQVAPTTDEDDILNEIRKSHDQRQLIEALLEKADEPTKQTISAFLESDSYRSAAKRIGVSHQTVIARIKAIARYFNANEFGDYRDYLIVPTA